VTDQEVIDAFQILWYEKRQRQTWRNTTWFGHELQQAPTDLWIYQELIHRTRPEVFVEIGIKRGGLTHYLASLFDLIYGADRTKGKVIGVDVGIKPAKAAVGSNPRVELIEGSSIDKRTFGKVEKAVAGRPVIVLLDSDHTEEHVRAELELYHRLIPVDGYLIVNDTTIGGHPVLEWKESSPFDAVHNFLSEHPEFELDADCEKHMLTNCRDGFLKRTR
jgi:cephalosporin hydroxylase